MSKGPTGSGKKFEGKKHLNVEIHKEDFCKVYNECLIDLNLDRNLCIFCEHREPLDVMRILDKQNAERNGR